MAYILLDTNTNIIWQYKKATNNAWIRLNLTQSDTTSFNYVNTYGTQTVNGAKTFNSAVTATRFNPNSSTVTGTGMFAPTSTSLGFSTNGTNKMTLDASGNLGLGVTPNLNWFTGGKILQIGATASLINNGSNNSLFAHNVIFNNSTSDYLITGAASYYRQLSGDHAWFTAPSGGAGTSATFNQVMLLSNSGNLSIGASGTANAKLEVLHTASTTIPALQVLSTGSLASNDILKFGVIGLTNGFRMFQNASSVLNYTFENGNVGIGTTTPQSGYRLHVVDSIYVGGNVSASAYTTRSDYDLKDEIQNISYGINEVMQMQPVKYTYKSNGSTQLGFIAQDLGVITPEVVSFEDKMSVYYNALIPILTKAIQEQNALIKALEQRILILENK